MLIPLLLVVLLLVSKDGFSESSNSTWDASLLNIEFHNVSINANDLQSAWQQIGTKYLFRANLYMDVSSGSHTAAFVFKKDKATGKELIDSILRTYSDYTYTQDQTTGIIWIHRKAVSYDSILNQKVNIQHPEYQVPMYDSVFLPLCHILAPKVNANMFNFGPPMNLTFDYCVDLPMGEHTVRDVLNYCCIWNITKCFCIDPNNQGIIIIQPVNLFNANPMAPPRPAAVYFWNIEIGKPTGEFPTPADIAVAMSDANYKKRWAARNYIEAAWENYKFGDIIEKGDTAEGKVWAAIGIGAVNLRRVNDPQSLIANIGNIIKSNLTEIKDPGLALVACLELAREKQEAPYLNEIVSKHKYSEADMASIKPDIYRLARESSLVLDKLELIKLGVPEFSPAVLSELEDTNLFTLVPGEEK